MGEQFHEPDASQLIPGIDIPETYETLAAKAMMARINYNTVLLDGPGCPSPDLRAEAEELSRRASELAAENNETIFQ
jgi:hypothetical protein